MPSDSVVAFLELARDLRLIADADLVRLADTPDDLPVVCDRLLSAGLLTRYQADRIRTGLGYTLGFAGYTILDAVDDDTYRAVEPTTGAEVRLSRFPAGTAVVTRSIHSGLPAPLADGTLGGEAFLVHRKPDGADLGSLVADMGVMPALLAAEYTRQAATALAALHACGMVHGRLRPDRLFVGPLVQASKPKPDGSPRFRPGPTATISVADYGVPAPGGTPPDDVFQLGGVLFHLLTARNPGEAPLSVSRPDLPAELTSLTKAMLAVSPADRPTMAEVVERLTALVSPHTPDAVPLGRGSSPHVEPANVALAETEQVELMNDPPRLALADGWAGHPAVVAAPPTFTPQVWTPPAIGAEPRADEHPSEEAPITPRRSRPSGAGARRELWLWAGAFVVLVALGVLVWVAIIVMNSSSKQRGGLTPTVRVS